MTSRGPASRALAMVLVLGTVGCVSHEDGTVVAINMSVANDQPTAFAPEVATFGIVSIELVRCESTLEAVWRVVSPIGVAYAHEWSGASMVAARAEHMKVTADMRTLELLSPAAGDYCSVRIGLGAGEGVPVALAVAGRFDGRPIEVSTQHHIDLVHELDPPVSLDADHLAADITFQVRPARWVDGLTAEMLEAGGLPLERLLAENVLQTTVVTVD